MNESQEIEKSEQRESDYFQKVSRNNRVNPFDVSIDWDEAMLYDLLHTNPWDNK